MNNNTGVQSGANLTGTTVSSKPVASQIATLQQPHLPWEVDQKLGHKSPLEYDVILPDKGKGKAVPNNTAQGGSGHDPPREWERTSHLLRRNESDDHLQSHSVHHHLTRRLDDKETWDELASEVKRVAESSAETVAEVMRKIEERHAETQASIASLNQCINALRKKY